MTPLQYIQRWYTDHCDGDWEHTFGVSIQTLDNPGWLLKIDIDCDQPLPPSENRSETDWVDYRYKNGQFIAAGGPHNLDEMLETFMNWVSTV